jgi:hypothetical protein
LRSTTLARPKSTTLFGLVFLVLILVRLPVLSGPINLSHDATEYIDIARNFAAGEGLVLKIRGYFFGDGLGVPYPAASLRSPLFPILMGCAYAVFPSDSIFRWFNFMLFLVNMLLLVLLLRPILPGLIAAYALLLIGLAEPMFLTSVFPWAEQTAFFWLLLGILLVSREVHVRWGACGAAIEGLVAAMASLSRPEYILVGILLFAWLIARTQTRLAVLGGFLAGFLPPLAIFFAANGILYGRSFLPGDYLFRSRHYAAYFSWESESAQGVGNFLTTNWLWIVERIARNIVNYLGKLLGWKNLFALAVALPLVVAKGARGDYPWRLRHLVLVPAAFFCAYCLVWAGIDRERYLLILTALLLPMCLLEVDQWRRDARRSWVRRASLFVIVINLPLLLGNVISANVEKHNRRGLGERFYAEHNPAWSNPDIGKLASWIQASIPEGEVLCLENPFLINYLTGRPTIVLPEQIQPHEFAKFLNYYNVRYWVNNTNYTKRRAEDLERLEQLLIAAGARETARCGTYRVYSTPRTP